MKGRNIRGQQKAMFAKRRKSPLISPKIRKLPIKFSNSIKEKSEEVSKEFLIDIAKDFIKSKIDNKEYDLKDSIKTNVLKSSAIIYLRVNYGIDAKTAEILTDFALKSVSEAKY